MPTLTVEQAKRGAQKSAEARRANALELERLRIRVKEFETALPAKQPVQPTESYIADRLNRVRKQIDSLSEMLDDELDPNKIDRLANAISRMSELERQLANRPLPGSLKPTQSKPTARRAIEPVPIACGPGPTTNSVPAAPIQPSAPQVVQPVDPEHPGA